MFRFRISGTSWFPDLAIRFCRTNRKRSRLERLLPVCALLNWRGFSSFLAALTARRRSKSILVLSLNFCPYVADAVSPHFIFTRGRPLLPNVHLFASVGFFLLWNRVRGLDSRQITISICPSSFLIGTHHRTSRLFVRTPCKSSSQVTKTVTHHSPDQYTRE